MRNRVLVRPPQITDNNLWNLLQRMLEFDRKVRISASEAQTHPFFTSNQAQQEVTKEQLQLAQTSQIAQRNGNLNITQFDINPNFIFPLIEVQKIIGKVDTDVQMAQFKAQIIPHVQQKQQQNQIINQPQINPPIQYNNQKIPINPTKQQQQLIQYQPISLLQQQQQQHQQQLQQQFPNQQPFPIQPVFDNQYMQQQKVIIQPIPQINQYQPQIDKQYQPIFQFPQQYQQQQFQQIPNLQPNITQPQLQVILPIQPLTIEQQKQTPQEQFEASLRLFKQQQDALITAKSINIQIQGKIIKEIQNIINELTENIYEQINGNLDFNEEVVEQAINSGFINELIDQIQKTPTDKIQLNIIKTLEKISQKGSAQQTHQLYLMRIIQILTPILKNKYKDIQIYILLTFVHIIKKGLQQLQSQSQSSSPSKSNLQQLLSIPHPYLDQLEQQQIIITLIQDVILNNESDMVNKRIACELLDALYSDGIKLPINLKQQIIKYFCDQSKSDYDNNRKRALESLVYIAVNQENHELIIGEDIINSAVKHINIEKSMLQVRDYSEEQCNFHLLYYLAIFGTPKTQQLIQNSISKETLNKLKDQPCNEAKYLFCSYSDPNSMNELIRIRGVVEKRSEEGIIELIKAGLIIRINELIEKSIKEDEEGMLILIGEIIEFLIKDNSKVSRIIIDESDFIGRYLQILSSIPPPQIKSEYLKPILNLSQNIQIEYQKKLFEKGVIQLVMKFLVLNDNNVRHDAINIILIIIKAGLDGLKERQQHPLHQQFQSDGTIPKLIQIFKNQDYYNHGQIAQTLAYLFKALPLPSEIRNNVIEQLKPYYFYELSLLAECPDNHDSILANQFEQKLFENDNYSLEYLNISLSILKYGSNINKLRVASAIKDKVQQLATDEYVDILGNRYDIKWNENKKQQIKSKSKELLPIIISIINDKNNVNIVSQLVTQIQDSNDNNVRKDSIKIILNFIKAGLDGFKSGQQHPFHQQFQQNGTIPKLIQIFKDEKNKDILRLIAQTLSYLFKSLPLPPEIRNNVIEQLKQKYDPDFNELLLLAECPDNHDAILANQFEMELFKFESQTLEYINFSLPILKYGSNIDKLKIASIIQEKVQQLTNDEYVDQLGNRYDIKWNENKKQEIKIKAKELFPMLISIIGDKEDAGKKK